MKNMSNPDQAGMVVRLIRLNDCKVIPKEPKSEPNPAYRPVTPRPKMKKLKNI